MKTSLFNRRLDEKSSLQADHFLIPEDPNQSREESKGEEWIEPPRNKQVDLQILWSKASLEKLERDLEVELDSWKASSISASQEFISRWQYIGNVSQKFCSTERKEGSRISTITRQEIIRSRIELKQPIKFIWTSFRISKSSYFSIMKNYKESGAPTEQHPTMESSSASNDLEIMKIAWEFIENKLPFTSTDVSKELASRTRTSPNPSAITKVLKKKLNLSYK